MPPSRVTDEQWLEYKPRIVELLQGGFPLSCKDGKRITVPDILRREFDITVTVPQLEAKKRLWGMRKNLKASEWKRIIPLLDELSQNNTKYRLKVAGQEIKKTTILKARQKLRTATSTAVAQEMGSLPDSNELRELQICILVRGGDGNGNWARYDGHQAETSASATGSTTGLGAIPLPSSAPVLNTETEIMLFSTQNESFEGPVSQQQLPLQEEIIPAFLEDFLQFHSGSSHTPASMRALSIDPSFLTNPETFGTLDFFQCSDGALNFTSPCPLAIDSCHTQGSMYVTAAMQAPSGATAESGTPTSSSSLSIGIRSGNIADSSLRLLAASPSPLHTLLGHTTQTRTDVPPKSPYSVPLPEIEELMDRLLCILPENEVRQCLESCEEMSDPGPVIRKVFLESILNNFAGIEDVPRASIMDVLRTDAAMRTELFEGLRSSSEKLARTVANNLFRAAIEADDAEVALAIVEAGEGQSYAISPNEIICRLDYKSLTPLELATKLRNIEMVRILLKHGADPNRTIQGSRALDCVLDPSEETESHTLDIVKELLEHGAKVYVENLKQAAKRGTPGLLLPLLEQMSKNAPCICSCPIGSELKLIKKIQSKKEVIAISERCIKWCVDSGCDEFRTKPWCQKLFATAAEHANLELLCELLVSHRVRAKMNILSAAIRGGNPTIIGLVLGQSIDITEAIPDALHRDRYKLSTPLAEAIRARNHELAQAFERLGAWDCLSRKINHFGPALKAAAEVGDLQCLTRILEEGTCDALQDLTDAFQAAVKHDQTPAAILLINFYSFDPNFFVYSEICVILKQKYNKRVFYAMVEIFFKNSTDYRAKFDFLAMALQAGVSWGETPLVQTMIDMGANVNAAYGTTPLMEAVQAKNREMVKLLLANGANPSQKIVIEMFNGIARTPLSEAIKSGDSSIIELLLSFGVEPADETAFLHAIETNAATFDRLLQLFRARYPQGRPLFGASLLIRSIKFNNPNVLRALLDAHMDPNYCFGHKPPLSPLGFAILNSPNTDVLTVLIDGGANVNGIGSIQEFGKYQEHCTALVLAVRARKEVAVRLLLEKGADVNHGTNMTHMLSLTVRRTPLQKACEIGSWSMVRLLLEYGADVNTPPAIRQIDGATALQLAARGGYIRIVELLLARGASVHAASWTPPDWLLPLSPLFLECRWLTALEGAASKGRLKMIGFLWAAAKNSQSRFSVDEIEWSIRYAKEKGHHGCADYISMLFAVQAASSRGISEGASDNSHLF